jgi:hypothetical protein
MHTIDTEFEYSWDRKKFKYRKSIESTLSRYKHRMELVRTLIGVVVLGIQVVILYHLLTK